MFMSHVQSSLETVAQFVTELREKVPKCEFAAVQVDEWVREQMAWLFEPKMHETITKA